MSQDLNYKHLYYFWVTAKEGGMSHAADRLGLAVQTVSAQVRLLEQSLGHALFKPAGRGLALTDAGQAALQVADQIFHLGEHLQTAVREAGTHVGVRLVVGISDGLPKLAVRDLLAPAMEEPNLRLLCHEDKFDDLLADLALHRLDVVLSDRPAPGNANIKLYNHALGSSAVSWYGSAALVPQLMAQSGGAIALVASVAGWGGMHSGEVDCATQAAVHLFPLTLLLDLHRHGIGVHVINPGFVATRLTAQNEFAMPALLTPEQAAQQIVRGFARGEFDIHFPKRFSWPLKLAALLPYRLYFWLAHKVTGL